MFPESWLNSPIFLMLLFRPINEHETVLERVVALLNYFSSVASLPLYPRSIGDGRCPFQDSTFTASSSSFHYFKSYFVYVTTILAYISHGGRIVDVLAFKQ